MKFIEFMLIYLISFVAITGSAYYVLERWRIKKALEDPAAARHSSLPAPDTIARVIAFIVIFFMFWSFTSALNDMSNDITGAISSGSFSIVSNMNLDEIEDTLKEQQSNLACFYAYCENEASGEYEIEAVPKTVSENTTVTVTLGKSHVTLTRGEGARYTGTLKFHGYEDYESDFVVSIETDGVIYSETVENCYM